METTDTQFMRLSGGLALATLLVMAGLCGLALAAPFFQDHVVATLARNAGVPENPAMTPARLWAVYAVALVPLAVLLWTLWQMRRLFIGFAAGDVLTETAARMIRRTGQGFLAMALTQIAVQPCLSVLLSWGAPAGERMLSLAISSDMIGFALLSGLLILIGWAMAQAAHQAAENRSFV